MTFLTLQYGCVKKGKSTLPPAAGKRLYRLDGKFIWTHALTDFIGPHGLVWQLIRMQMASSHHCNWLRPLSHTAQSVTLFHAVCPLVISCYPPLWNRSLAHLIESDEISNGLFCASHLLCHEDTLICSFYNKSHTYIKGHVSVQQRVSSPKLSDLVFRLYMMLAVKCKRFQDQCNAVHFACNQIKYIRFNNNLLYKVFFG